MIIHQVNHIKYNQPLLSDLETPLNPDVVSYLTRHIQNNRKHRYTRTAVFADNTFQAMCDTIFDDPDQLVPQSRAIAEHLFESIDQRISPIDLVICLYREGNDSFDQLALLKLDPSVGYVGERKTDETGNAYFELRRVGDVLPTSELQKCAFVLSSKLRKKERYHPLW